MIIFPAKDANLGHPQLLDTPKYYAVGYFVWYHMYVPRNEWFYTPRGVASPISKPFTVYTDINNELNIPNIPLWLFLSSIGTTKQFYWLEKPIISCHIPSFSFLVKHPKGGTFLDVLKILRNLPKIRPRRRCGGRLWLGGGWALYCSRILCFSTF